VSELVDLPGLLLPADWSLKEMEKEARRVYFEELVPNPPALAVVRGMDNLPLEVTGSEGSFRHLFGKSEGWASYHHSKTGELDVERMRRVHWIRPVLEMRAKGTRIYVNNHSMKPREYGTRDSAEKKRLYIVTQTGLIYFISLKYLEKSLVLTTAFEPDGRWARETVKKRGTTLLFPCP
jgi:hypothetical protein